MSRIPIGFLIPNERRRRRPRSPESEDSVLLSPRHILLCVVRPRLALWSQLKSWPYVHMIMLIGDCMIEQFVDKSRRGLSLIARISEYDRLGTRMRSGRAN